MTVAPPVPGTAAWAGPGSPPDGPSFLVLALLVDTVLLVALIAADVLGLAPF